jgi:hypothetical protein
VVYYYYSGYDTTAASIWALWNQPYTVTNATGNTLISNPLIWSAWNVSYYYYPTGGTGTGEISLPAATYVAAPPETDEQRQVRLAAEAEARKKAEEAALKQVKARERARDLLHRHLDPQQRESLEKQGAFLVHTKRGVYRVQRGVAGNIQFLGKPGLQPSERYCIHVPHQFGLPEEDHMLTQKLLLEADEDTFLRVANRTVM